MVWELPKVPPFFRPGSQFILFVLVLSAQLAWYPCPFEASDTLPLNDRSVTEECVGSDSLLTGAMAFVLV